LNKDVCDLLEAIEMELEQRIQESPQEGPAAALETFLEDLKHDPSSGTRAVERYSALLAATCQGAGGDAVLRIFDTEKIQFDTVIVDEAARANPLDLIIPMSLAGRRVVLVGDHRQLPHLLEPDVERELASSANEETQNAIKQSLFEKLFTHARALESKDGIKRCVTLNRQYRMHPVLAELVNSTFYKPFGEEFGSPSDDGFATSFEHDVAEAKHRVVLWKSVPLSIGPEQHQKNGHSRFRQPEAEVVAETAQKILRDNPDLSIGIITFYSAQVDAIMQELHTTGIAAREEESGRLIIAPNFAQFPAGVKNRFGDKERLRVGTVDAFQGKEFDVVILSPVRANNIKPSSDPEQAQKSMQRKYGHLLLPNRMCVSLSRQRRLLIVVGDDAMFADFGESTHMADHHEGEHPVPGLARILCLHEEFQDLTFEKGGALRS
jgi:superfamily I DNA and/or RNA helicase